MNFTAVPLNPVVQVSINWRFLIFCLGLKQDAHLALV
ncbi:hypothetical protein B6N60_01171 [Richelia sinica FACHB-800]|uniref:Uncharacterized protein n=1 Tax=Richelia sinica FACHB-800 TaxID=1357546 RepID=A0A975T5D9_9NOST|nr:hypothetical protein B6N60_01171 [Richelia sinica FACHB-800]